MDASIIYNLISTGQLDEIFSKLYIDPSTFGYQRTRYADAIEKFEKLFGTCDISIFSAPGRTEIGGNHTDHQHGQVLAAAINNDAIAVASKCEGAVHLFSKGYGQIDVDMSSLVPVEEEKGTTKALIRGVLAGMKSKGYAIGGFCAYVTSDVLSGSGLSSSAAFESLIGVILSGLYNDGNVNPVEIAKVGQFSENVYLGKPCGLMDQMASSVGSLCYIDFKDPSDPVIEKVDFSLDTVGYSLCITDTKGSHADLTPDYAAVPAEMNAAAAVFGKEVLRDVSDEDILSGINKIREAAGDRAALRAIHFMDETKRAQMEAEALKAGDFRRFLQVFKKSADSSFKYLQNVYTTHDITHQNVTLGIAVSELVLDTDSPDPADNAGVVRVHGGGFAGTIQAFVKNDHVEDYKKTMNALFGEGSCNVLKIRSIGCVMVI